MEVRDLVNISIERAKRWHKGDISNWTTLEWAGAMCGEAGETANAAKKLKRLINEIPSINAEKRHFTDVIEAKNFVAHEVCDTILYAVLVAASVGLDGNLLEELLAKVFNNKSIEYGFPERLTLPENKII